MHEHVKNIETFPYRRRRQTTKASRYGWWALCLLLLSSCQTSTFLISKNGNYGYFGRVRPYLHEQLCVREELKEILADSNLPENVQTDFFEYVCSERRSYEKAASLYLFLSPDEKKRFKASFVKHGYEVNHVNC